MEVETQADIKNVLLPTPKVIPRVEPKKGSVVYAMQKSLLHFWVKGEIMDVIRMGPGKSVRIISCPACCIIGMSIFKLLYKALQHLTITRILCLLLLSLINFSLNSSSNSNLLAV